ncbi:hypothetical protein F183_A54880 (plasmid) [Bryobacterales bacterium F-183]|nr:hypothetical protein F183_A54880 [Bryobacterales bacterium F-183]
MVPAGLMVLATASAFLQQDVRLSGPVSGWVYDPPTKSIRTVAGMPGAAVLGRAAFTDLAWASVAPAAAASSGKAVAALALREEGGALTALRADGTETTVDGWEPVAAGLPRLMAWSENGSRAILVLDARDARVISITGDSVAASRLPLVESEAAAKITSIAASRDEWFASVAGAGIYRSRFDSPSEPTLLTPSASAEDAVLALDSARNVVYALEREAGILWRVSSTNGEATVLSQEAAVLAGSTAIGVATSGRQLLVARGTSDRKLHRLDLEAMTWSEVPYGLDGAPGTMFAPLSRAGVFLLGLRGSEQEALYLWDESADSVFFVPAAAQAAVAAGVDGQ